jgi:hypothetical protein
LVMKGNGFVFAVVAAMFAFMGCEAIQDFLGFGEDTVLVKGDPWSGFQLVSAFSNGKEESGSAIDVIRKHAGEAEVKIRLERGREEVQFGQGDFANGVIFNTGNSPKSIIIDGDGGTVDLTGDPTEGIDTGYLITVGGGVTLTLTNITLKGLNKGDNGDTSDNNVPLVIVVDGTLIMDTGAKVKDNVNAGGFIGYGGVWLMFGTFEMKGNAEISNNTVTNGGEPNGGGVAILAGTFRMSENARIFDNEASSGGGVFLTHSSGTFEMKGGTISGNKATNGKGGGVCVDEGTFNKTGGIIYGSNGGGNSNTATKGDGYGHAVGGNSTTVHDLTW